MQKQFETNKEYLYNKLLQEEINEQKQQSRGLETEYRELAEKVSWDLFDNERD